MTWPFRLFLAAIALAPAVALAAAPGLDATPLVLKDGRMADVSVHAFAFKPGAGGLDPAEAARLAELGQDLTTDCFLTAQAIGHADPDSKAEGDTLGAHRLARARADGVQKALAAAGLPATAVASVWDWRFLVRDPRVTLWVFQLRRGEDCTGNPLAGRKAPAVADAGSAAGESKASVAAEPRAAKPTPASPPAAAAAPPPPEAVDEAASAPGQIAAVTPAEPPPAEAETVIATAPPAGEAPAGLTLTFESNSSYLPRGAGAELKKAVEALPRQGGYAVELVAAVGGTDMTSGDAAKAARYNRWLAERRLARVKEWLEQNVEVVDLRIDGSLAENDPSREVRIRIRPRG